MRTFFFLFFINNRQPLFMKRVKLLKVKRAPRKGFKKWCASFSDPMQPNKIIRRCFGDRRYKDYTMHKDKDRRLRYVNRHAVDLKVKKSKSSMPRRLYPTRPGYLSMFLLWNKPTLKQSIKDFRKRLSENDWSLKELRKVDRLNVPKHYVPKSLSKEDRKRQTKELIKSRQMYKRGKYHTRKKMKSFKSKKSRHIDRVSRIYKIGVDDIDLKQLVKRTQCSKKGLNKIVRKGMGAYYSSGSRPNQTPHSWGVARLYSAISGGPASRVDYKILKKYCNKNSNALKLAIKK